MAFNASINRYSVMKYNRIGRSGLKLPALSLGLWQNFGSLDPFERGRKIVLAAFDAGITHFDLANNYGPEPGSAEENFGRIINSDLLPYRDEIIVSSKAGFYMWPGPYGEWGSRKYLLASLNQSLKRLGLEYVDIFYHHRPDPETPLEETMGALDSIVKQGKALYVGISNYGVEESARAIQILRNLGTPCLIHQPRYSLFDRRPEQGLLDLLAREGVGSIVFSPLEQGQLTNKYLHGIPPDSRAAGHSVFLKPEQITEEKISKIRSLNEIAQSRGQTLAQMALAWVLRGNKVSSVLLGASKVEQIHDNVACLAHLDFSEEECSIIDKICFS